MKNNPLAKVVREAFIKNVLAKPSDEDVAEANKNNIGNILKNKRIVLFENAFFDKFRRKASAANVVVCR